MSQKLRRAFVYRQHLAVKINDLTKKPKMLFWCQKTQTTFSFSWSSCCNNFNTPALSPTALGTPNPTGRYSYLGCQQDSSCQEMQNEKYGALKTYSINSSCGCGDDCPPPKSLIRFLVAGTSLGYPDIILGLWQAARGGRCPAEVSTVSPRPLPACCSSFSGVTWPQGPPVGSG